MASSGLRKMPNMRFKEELRGASVTDSVMSPSASLRSNRELLTVPV
jgi:hypothetical protein